MLDSCMSGILNLMGYLASFFFPLDADNYLFVELATFLVVLLTAIVLIFFFANQRGRRKSR